MRVRISPASRRCTASGLIRMSERSSAKAAEVYSGRGFLPGAPAPARGPHLEGRELDGGRLDRCLAIRADLPERLERRLAVRVRACLQIGRASCRERGEAAGVAGV